VAYMLKAERGTRLPESKYESQGLKKVAS